MADTFLAPKVVTDDGEVPFVKPVAGVTPTANEHLATKAYVDSVGGGGGGGAPTDAQYLVAAGNATLSAERVTTDTATVTWDHGTAGQAKANVPDATTTTKGAVELATSGEASAGVVVQGNDARLSDARTPTAHASSHAEAGSDRITALALANNGLTVRDTDDSHELTIKPGSNLTADRTLTVATGDANRTLTLAADASVAGANNGDQPALSTVLVTGSDTLEYDAPGGELTVEAGSGIAVDGDAATKTLTISATGLNFGTVAVTGQSNVVADVAADTLNLANGGGVAITTTSGTDTVTFTREALTGDVTASAGSGSTTIANDAVTNAKLADVATATIKGRATAGTGDPEDLTGTQATALLDVFTSGAKGLVPASGGGVTKFARADGSWAVPTVADDEVTMAKLANLATDRLIGRDTAGTGDPEALTVGGGVEFTGSGGIQRSALTGDITASAGSNSTTIATGAVSTAKMGGDVTTAGKALLDDADAAAQRTTLGLGTVATESTVPISKGGTGQTTKTLAMNELSPATTKGDLLVRDSTNVVRLAVGADESIPIADSAASAGITWVLRDVETRWVLFDDCFWASLPNGGWTQGSSGTGTSAASSTFGVDSTEKAQGVVALSTGTDAGTGRSSFYQCLNSLLLGQGTAFEYEARVCLSNLSTAAQEFVVHFGFIDNANASSEPADSAAFVYRRTTDGDFWVCCTRSNSAETKTVTATEPSTSAFAVFKIVIPADGGKVTYYIDGVQKAEHSTNVPTGAGRLTGIGQRIYKTAGSTARLAYFDWIRIKATGSAR